MRVRSTLVVFVASFLVYFISTEHLITTVRWPTGDEPYYLLIAHSLVYDHDFELTNNFAHEDYRAYYPGELYPRHEAVTPKPILVSKHSLGLPLLIAPAYALDGWRGAAHMLNLFGALLAVNIFLLAREVSGSQRAALAVCAALALSAPFFTYSELIFPEVPAALLIVYAYRHLRDWNHANRAQKFLTVLGLAYLPWLHARFLFVVAALGLWFLANEWDVVRRLKAESRTRQVAVWVRPWLPFAVCLLPSIVLFLAYNVYVYNSLIPNYSDHSGTGHPAEIFAAFFGVWLDQQWGLLNHAPIYLLALTALMNFRLKIKNLKSEILNLKWPLLVTLPYFLLIVQYRYWWGEWCPPARYLTPILPLLAAPLTVAFTRVQTRRFRTTCAALTLLGWGVALAFALDGRLMYNQPLGKSALLVALGNAIHLDLTRFEPSFIMLFLTDFDPVQWAITQTALTIVWMVVLGVIALSAFGAIGRARRLTAMAKFPIMRATAPQEE